MGVTLGSATSLNTIITHIVLQWWVKERAPEDTLVGVIQAHDMDGDGLTYRFIGKLLTCTCYQ